jgi:hypothetical protein
MVAAVANIHPVSHPKHPLMLDDLAAFRATMPRLRRPSAELLREARNKGLYERKASTLFRHELPRPARSSRSDQRQRCSVRP